MCRVPHSRFAGKSGHGLRGDAIMQLDWTVGQVLDALKRNDLEQNTLVIFTSDNGPVLDDGYHDQANELLGKHDPNGPFAPGKYSAFEGGTCVPFRCPLAGAGRRRPGDSAPCSGKSISRRRWRARRVEHSRRRLPG